MHRCKGGWESDRLTWEVVLLRIREVTRMTTSSLHDLLVGLKQQELAARDFTTYF